MSLRNYRYPVQAPRFPRITARKRARVDFARGASLKENPYLRADMRKAWHDEWLAQRDIAREAARERWIDGG